MFEYKMSRIIIMISALPWLRGQMTQDSICASKKTDHGVTVLLCVLHWQ